MASHQMGRPGRKDGGNVEGVQAACRPGTESLQSSGRDREGEAAGPLSQEGELTQQEAGSLHLPLGLVT